MNEKYRQEGKWWVSPYNFVAEVREHLDLPERVRIHDATLRDGEQTPGVVFRKRDKVEIAELLAEVGVERIEAGMPAVSEEDFQAIREISKLGLSSKIFTFARTLTADIDKALECGARGVIVEIPIGYPKLKYQFNWSWEDVLIKSIDCIKYAKQHDLEVVYFPYDTTRARPEDLSNLLSRLMEEAPPDSIGIVDTMGCALPEAVSYLVRWVKKLTGLPIEIHTHNDFGMAVATELAAVAAGAEVVHSCVNGLSERTGNAALEELIMGLHVLMGMDTAYRLDKILPLCQRVADISGIQPARNKPIIGEANYTRESGIGVDLVVNKPLAMFATDPALTGRKGKIVLGKKSGKLSVQYMLDQLGVKVCDEHVIQKILQAVKQRGTEKRALLSLEEFKEIAGNFLPETRI